VFAVAAAVVLVAVAGVLVGAHPAFAEYRGSSPFDDFGPHLTGNGGLLGRIPDSALGLDSSIHKSIWHPSSVVASWRDGMTADVWGLVALGLRFALEFLSFCFTADVLGGPHGALVAVGQATHRLYQGLSVPFTTALVVGLGGWATWTGMAQRRFSEAISGIAVSIALAVVALMIVSQPVSTISSANRWSTGLGTSLLTDATGGQVAASDRLVRTLVLRPWTELEFGGTTKCVDPANTSADGFPKPVSALAPGAQCVDTLQRYGQTYLKSGAANGPQRDHLYDLIDHGRAPYKPADAVAVDIQQEGGMGDRFRAAILIAVGSLGPILMLSYLGLAALLSEVAVLVLLPFAALMWFASFLPDVGHEVFKKWGKMLLLALVVKVLIAVTIVVLVVVGDALTTATSAWDFWTGFFFQSFYWWAAFIFRKQLGISSGLRRIVQRPGHRSSGRGKPDRDVHDDRYSGSGQRAAPGRPGQESGLRTPRSSTASNLPPVDSHRPLPPIQRRSKPEYTPPPVTHDLDRERSSNGDVPKSSLPDSPHNGGKPASSERVRDAIAAERRGRT
jgi:hypothetical protein